MVPETWWTETTRCKQGTDFTLLRYDTPLFPISLVGAGPVRYSLFLVPSPFLESSSHTPSPHIQGKNLIEIYLKMEK